MWLLQRKNIHKKHLLWLKIIGLCLSFHLIVLLWVFCIYRENKYMYTFSISKKMDYSIPIIFLPAYAKATAGAAPAEQKPTATITPKVITPKPAASSFAKAPADKPKTVAKPIKNELAKATNIETPPKKVESYSAKATKDTTKKIIEPVKTVAPAETIKSVTPEKPAVIEKVETVQKIEPASAHVSEEALPVLCSLGVRGAKSEAIADKQKKETPSINAQVSNNFREVEALRRGAQLQKELVQKWQPPIGVSPDCTCDISFFVNKEGIIQNLKMAKSSGVMMFDISARQALFAMKMPQWTYGKPLIISFKQ